MTHKNTWFDFMCEKIIAGNNLKKINLASAMALVGKSTRSKFLERIGNIVHFDSQVTKLQKYPGTNLVLVWIGHNNMDWRMSSLDYSSSLFEKISESFCYDYEQQLKRIIESPNAACIAVFGLSNFKDFFAVREVAEEMIKANQQFYPYLLHSFKYYESMLPEFRSGICELAKLCNQKLKDLCARIHLPVNKKIFYVDALSLAQIDNIAYLNAKDAWHPSKLGHEELANAAYPAIKEILEKFC